MSEKIRSGLIFLGMVLLSSASVVLAAVQPEDAVWRFVTYVVYGLAALFLGLAVWQTVLFFKRKSLRERIAQAARKTELTGRIYDDYTFRTLLTGYGSLAISVFFALTKAAFGWYNSSIWLIALAFYYLFLCVTKALVLRQGRKRVPGETANERLLREWKIYRLCGVLLMGMTFALQGVIILIIEEGNTFSYRGTLIFAVALYDFYCLISSVIYMVRTRKKHSPVVVAVKSIKFATSLVAMLTLQTAMFASFADGTDEIWQKRMNIMTGTAVCAILILWGAFMVWRSLDETKRLEEESK